MEKYTRPIDYTKGRPTKYKREYCQRLIDWFNVDVVMKIVDDPTGKGGTSTHFETVRVPSIRGFAASIGVHHDTLYEWAKAVYPDGNTRAGKLKHPEFSDALSRAQSIEEALIFEYGMAGRLDRGLAAMYFTNKLGFKDSKHLDLTSAGGQLPTPILAGVTSNQDGLPGDNSTTEDTQAS